MQWINYSNKEVFYEEYCPFKWFIIKKRHVTPTRVFFSHSHMLVKIKGAMAIMCMAGDHVKNIKKRMLKGKKIL